MAKRRGGGGGSGMGLIMTLVFFILTTITLGVTTYMGYAEVDKFKTETKAEKEKTAAANQEKNWWKFQANLVRVSLGEPYKDEKDDDNFRTLLQKDREEFLKSPDGKVTNKFDKPAPAEAKEFKDLLERMDKVAPWKVGEQAPSTSYINLLAARDGELKKEREKVDEFRRDLEEVRADKAQTQAKLTETSALFKTEVAKVMADAAKNRKSDTDQIANLQKLLNATSEEKAKAETERGNLEVSKKDVDEKLKATEASLKTEIKDKVKAEAERAQLDNDNRELKKRLPDEKKSQLEKGLTAEATKALNRWPQEKLKWQIVRLDQKGDQPYINLGSADGLEPQLTFYVHALGRDGKLSPVPKGTVEVIQLVPDSPHLARVRVTSVTDPNRDPIVAGDRLFNPIWGPGQPKRVAIAGVADVGGEGTENNMDLRRILTRNNVVVDAYIDTRNEKEPAILDGKGGKGAISPRTNYLIVGDDIEGVARHPRREDKEYKAKFTQMMTEMRDRATASGVTVISVSAYLDLIGHRTARPSPQR